MASIKEIRDLSPAELQTRVQELDREIFDLKNQLAFHRKLDKPHLMKAKKKEKAQTLTVLAQKQAVGS